MRFFQVFVGVILTVTSVLASPFNRFSTRDLYILNTCDDFVLGNDQNSIGKVCISISGGTLTVTYPALPSTDAYSDIHVYIGTTIPTVTSPGKLPYTFGNGYCTISADKTEATCTIPVEDSWRACNSPLYIATHASLTYSGAGQTGWGAGSCYGSSTGNCAKYWSFTTQCQCPVIYSYEPITVTYTTSSISTVTYTTSSTTTVDYVTSSSTTPPPLTTSATCTDANAPTTTSVIVTTTTL